MTPRADGGGLECRPATAQAGSCEFIAPLARAAVATGIDGIFMEVHEDPDRALSDGPNSYRLDQLATLLDDLKRLHEIAQEIISSVSG